MLLLPFLSSLLSSPLAQEVSAKDIRFYLPVLSAVRLPLKTPESRLMVWESLESFNFCKNPQGDDEAQNAAFCGV